MGMLRALMAFHRGEDQVFSVVQVRRITIVALARKLLIALWRFLETGLVPDGAELKA